MAKERDGTRIIRARAENIDQLVPLFDGYRVFYNQPSDPPGARAYLLDRLANDESIIFLAIDSRDGAAAGFTQLYPSFSSVSMTPRMILYDLFVAPAKRRMGVGRALMERAYDCALDGGFRSISLSTALDNVAGQTLYESLGYSRDDAFYHYELPVPKT